MVYLVKYLSLVFSFYLHFLIVQCDVLDTERSAFFGFTHEIPLSASTLELVEQLQSAVHKHARGDRRVRRYFDNYDTPFVGVSRRKVNARRD